VAALHGSLPLSFIENEGQFDREVRYYSQGQASASTSCPTRPCSPSPTAGEERHSTSPPLGANPNTRLFATRPGQGRVNYLVGSEHHSNLASYHELTYRELWPGIDMVFRGQGGRLKYEFRVAPGADASQIRLADRRVERLSLGSAGGAAPNTPLRSPVTRVLVATSN
jgi:hypothetical protein